MGFTSEACWFLLIKTLLIKNNKKREVALKNEVGGDKKHVCFFYLALQPMVPAFQRKQRTGGDFLSEIGFVQDEEIKWMKKCHPG